MPRHVVTLPLQVIDGWPHAASEISALDVDNNGKPDLVLTSHVQSLVTPIIQQSDGSFDSSPPLDGVGFHPNGVVGARDADANLTLIQNAETLGELRLYDFDEGTTHFRGSLPALQPLQTMPLRLADNGLALVVQSKTHIDFTVLHGVDLREASFLRSETIRATPAGLPFSIDSPLVAQEAPGRRHIVFIDSRHSIVRALGLGPEGSVSFTDLASFSRADGYSILSSLDLNRDGRDDLLMTGLNTTPLRILLSNEAGGFDAIDTPLTQDYTAGLVAFRTDPNLSFVILSRDHELLLMKLDNQGRLIESKRLPIPPSVGQVMMATADFDLDGATDLAIATSGRRGPAPAVLYGPLWEHWDALEAHLGTVAAQSEPKPVTTRRPLPQTGTSAGQPAPEWIKPPALSSPD